MDVGSAKVLPAECREVPHHMLSVVDPVNKVFSVGDYYDRAAPVLKVGKTHHRNNIRVVV